MSVDPYEPCPCGSGKKFKWCCQKVAKHAEKAEQLLEKDQPAAALAAIEEGLAADPGNLWLSTLKLEILLTNHDHEAAEPLMRAILEQQPGNVSVLAMKMRHQFEHGDGAGAAETLQHVLGVLPAGGTEGIEWIEGVGRVLAASEHYYAALAHLRFAAAHLTEPEAEQPAGAEPSGRQRVRQDLALIEASQTAPWLKQPRTLRPPPHAVPAALAPRWQEALGLAAAGRWRDAAVIFEQITGANPELADAWLNLGLLRAWIVRDQEAADALVRYAALEPDAEQAVEVECLAQCLASRPSQQSVDVLTWRLPIHDRTRLFQSLREHPRLQLQARAPDEDANGQDEFYLLDQPILPAREALQPDNVPAVVGFVRLAGNNLQLELADPAPDDERLKLIREVAGDSVAPPEEPERIGSLPVSFYRLHRMWGMTPGQPAESVFRLRQALFERMYRATWPDTPQGWLGNQTPRAASVVPELRRALRAALLIVEYEGEAAQFVTDLGGVRDALGLPPEPLLEGPSLDPERIPLSRLGRVRAESLDFASLRALFARAQRFGLPLATQHVAAALVHRPPDASLTEAFDAFRALIQFAIARYDAAAAQDWVAQARGWDKAIAAERATWDVLEWLLSARTQPIQHWAPQLAALLEKFTSTNRDAGELTTVLLELGLLRLVRDPADPQRMVLDTRLLDSVILRYGTRQAGALDLTPAAPEAGKIWTPDAGRPEAPGVWAPGQEPAKPSKLWVPDR